MLVRKAGAISSFASPWGLGISAGRSPYSDMFLDAIVFSHKRKASSNSKKGLLWYKTTGNVLLGTIEGIVKGVVDIFKGLWDLLVVITTDPLGFLKGIVNAVLHPVKTAQYLWGAFEHAWKGDVINGDARSPAKFFTYSLVSIFGLKGIDKMES